MTKIRIKTNFSLAKTKISAPREAKEERKEWGERREKQERSKRKTRSKAILRYFLAYFDLSSYFEDMVMNL